MFKSFRQATKLLPLAVAIALLPVITPLASAQQQSAPTKETFQALYNQRDAAYRRKDIDALMKTVAKDYQSFRETGVVNVATSAKERDRLVRVFKIATTMESKTVVQSVSMVGKGAVVTVSGDYLRTQYVPSRNITGRMHEEGQYRYLLVNSAGVWQVKQERNLRLKKTSTINGQVVN